MAKKISEKSIRKSTRCVGPLGSLRQAYSRVDGRRLTLNDLKKIVADAEASNVSGDAGVFQGGIAGLSFELNKSKDHRNSYI